MRLFSSYSVDSGSRRFLLMAGSRLVYCFYGVGPFGQRDSFYRYVYIPRPRPKYGFRSVPTFVPAPIYCVTSAAAGRTLYKQLIFLYLALLPFKEALYRLALLSKAVLPLLEGLLDDFLQMTLLHWFLD